MAKQVEETVPAVIEPQAVDTTQHSTNEQSKNLYVSVKTFDGKTGKPIGERVVDMYHYGTRNWLQNHIWWAMHNSHEVQQDIATDEEIGSYMAKQEIALAEKFNKTRESIAA